MKYRLQACLFVFIAFMLGCNEYIIVGGLTKTIEMIAPATLAVKIRDNKSEVKLVAKAVQVLPIKKIKISASKTRCRKKRLPKVFG